MVNWVMVDSEQPIEAWNAPAGTVVDGDLDLSDSHIQHLPEQLTVTGCLTLDGCLSLHELPSGLRCYKLSARGSALCSIPADIQVQSRMDLSDCTQLEALPAGLKVG